MKKVLYKLTLRQQVGLQSIVPSLKLLKNKIWSYKGKVYKLRVSSVSLSSGILFFFQNDEIIELRGFTKTTAPLKKMIY
ncbi:hypothetical protein CXF86_18025 [Shewanella sp. GutCb]|nr:hypothetical protein CXF86_18025 [Shewanella sp. GutCb]